MDQLYLTEVMRTQWIKVLDTYWDEGNKTYLSSFGFSPHWLIQNNDDITVGSAI